MDQLCVRNPDCFLLCFQAVQILGGWGGGGGGIPVVEHAIMAVGGRELLQGFDLKRLASWVIAECNVNILWYVLASGKDKW